MITLSLLALGFQNPSISQFVDSGLRDLKMTVRVVKGDQRELAKINKDFGQAYRIESTLVQIKEPMKLKVESEVDDINASYTINGSRRMFKFKSLKQVQDLSSSPGKLQTSFDFGILTSSLFNSLYSAKFLRIDRATGAAVFEFRYQAQNLDTSSSRVWIDPEKKIIIKREWFNQENRQLATFLYSNPKKYGSIWLNTKVTVKNVDDKVAGITQIEGVSVNSGISDSVFDLR